MRSLFFLLAVVLIGAVTATAGPTPKELVTQLYQAHGSKHDPLDDTKRLGGYFDTALLKLYLIDKRQANGEVGRLDGDPLYNAQEIKITDFNISPPETLAGETRVIVRFKNLGKRTGIIYLLKHQGGGWKISDIRYDDGSSLKKILQSDN